MVPMRTAEEEDLKSRLVSLLFSSPLRCPRLSASRVRLISKLAEPEHCQSIRAEKAMSIRSSGEQREAEQRYAKK